MLVCVDGERGERVRWPAIWFLLRSPEPSNGCGLPVGKTDTPTQCFAGFVAGLKKLRQGMKHSCSFLQATCGHAELLIRR